MPNIPPIGQPPDHSLGQMAGGKSGEPHYEIRESNTGIIKGPYFVLVDSSGKVVHTSNVYAAPDDEGFCEDGAERELKEWIGMGSIS